MPGHEEWANDFLAYVFSLKFEICPVKEHSSVYGDLNKVMHNQIIIHMVRKIDSALAEAIVSR